MARIRTIKPEFPQSESMGRVSREARLCFILLFTLADDEGRLRGNSRMLASLLYPYDDDAKKHIEGWLSDLHANGCIIRYEIDGDQYIEICKWLIHQKIDKPSASKIPPPKDDSRGFAKVREGSTADQGEDQGIDQGKDRKRSATLAPPDGVSSSVWSDFLAVRKAKKAPMTQAALEGIQREADKAGWKLEDALKECCSRGWQSFKADWVTSKPQTHAQVAADVARVTVPARQGRDPVLEKIEQDALAAVKPSPEILARMAALRGH